MILNIVERGTSLCRRFVVANPYGFEFAEDTQEFIEGKGTLYYSRNDAALKVREILLAEYGDKPVRRFRTFVDVEVHAGNHVTLEAVQDWCMAATRLILFPENGLGPGGDGNLGFCSINWAMLEEFPSE